MGMASVEEIPQVENREHQGQGLAAFSPARLRWWFLVSVYTVGLIISHAGGTLLVRFYYNNGGQSQFLTSIVSSAGFLLAVPFFFFAPHSSSTNTSFVHPLHLALAYFVFGVIIALNNWMYAYGLMYLPVSTYSLLCATELAFSAVFSYFMNAQKLSQYISSSVVLLTISAVIVATHTEESGPSHHVSKGRHISGVLITIGASALYALGMSLFQIWFDKVLKTDTIWVTMKMQIYPGIVATCICVGSLFVSKEWRGLEAEMEGFKTGKLSYFMTIFWTMVLWEVYSLSCLGLTSVAGSLLSNVASTVGLPVVPLLAVVFFKDKMDGMKILALVLAVLGFASYLYHHYLDDKKATTITTPPPPRTNADENSN